MVASEAHPFSKTGGLADVATALSAALGGSATTSRWSRRAIAASRPAKAARQRPRVRRRITGSTPTCTRCRSGDERARDARRLPAALRSRRHLRRAQQRLRRQPDSLRVSVHCRARVGGAASRDAVSVFHAHDWQAGLLPVYARRSTGDHGDRACPPSVFTIHNLAYQGVFDKAWVPRLGLALGRFHVSGFEFWDRLSFLKAGVMFSDALTTVSPTYAEEIQRPEYGYGFDGVMRARARRARRHSQRHRRSTSGIRRAIASCRRRSTPTISSGKRQAKRALLETVRTAGRRRAHAAAGHRRWCRAWSSRRGSI